MKVNTQVHGYFKTLGGHATQTLECDVLTVHFEKGTMRVRYIHPETGAKKTCDVSSKAFFEKYDITEVN